MSDFKNLKTDTLIFDLDGTLLDTLDDLKDAVNYAFSFYNYPPCSKEDVRCALGRGAIKLFEYLLPDGENNPNLIDCLINFKSFYVNIKQSKTKPYDGILELLEKLKASGYKIGILSNKFDKGTKIHSEKFFGNLVDFAQGEDENNGILRKPSPIGLYKVIEKLNSKKENCIFVGDSEIDIQTAKNAGIPCISVLWGFRSKEFLIDAGGENFVFSPSEIFDML